MALFNKTRQVQQPLRKRGASVAADAAAPFDFAMLSHLGRVRQGNEDTCAADPAHGIFVVCDGMGGAAAGEVASRLATDIFLEHLVPASPPSSAESPRRATPDVRMNEAIHAANQAVYGQAQVSPKLCGMGTTLVALLLELHAGKETQPRPSLTLAHVGDSRCYLFRDGALTRLTEDHSLVEEQVRSGQITAEEAEVHPMRNIITRAVGAQASVQPEITPLPSLPGDLFLLASDGLTRELAESAIQTILTRALALQSLRRTKKMSDPDLAGICQTLVDEANDAGGGDNITVLLLRTN